MGWFLLLVAGLMVFGTLGTLGSLLKALGTLVLGIQGKAGAGESAQALGALIAQMLIFLVIYFAWTYGRKWTRKNVDALPPNNSKL